jgi:hypothetical protein
MSTSAYLRRTDKNGKSVVTHHYVWDLGRFLESQQREQRELAAKGKDSVTITVATEQEYREFTWPKNSTKEKTT